MEPTSTTVLLVEDNADHAALVLRHFKKLGGAQDVFHVSDGEAALDYLFRRGRFSDPASSPRPRVVLLDLRLPRVDGLEVLREIKATPHLRSIPVVVLTTSSAEPDVDSAYDRHVNSYLVKPADFSHFAQLMTDVGAYWLGWNRYVRS